MWAVLGEMMKFLIIVILFIFGNIPVQSSPQSNFLNKVLAVRNAPGCNNTNVYQVPENPNLFLGRKLINTNPSDLCSGTSWSLTFLKMDWKALALTEVASDLLHPARIGDGSMIISAYDASAMIFQREIWIAFECVTSNGSVNACVGPLRSDYQLDLLRTSVVITGRSITKKYELSASVLKLLNFKEHLYLYGTAGWGFKFGLFLINRSLKMLLV